MKAQANTSCGPDIPVSITLDPNGRPDVKVANARALFELLGREGFLLDPTTGRCRLPESVRDPSEAGWRATQAVRKLDSLGFSVTTRLADGRTFRSSDHGRATTADHPPTGYPQTPRRAL